MTLDRSLRRRVATFALGATVCAVAVTLTHAQQTSPDTRDPRQTQDSAFAQAYKEWTGDAKYGSPLVDHLPLVKGIPTPKDVLGYHIGAPAKLTYYADILRYYRALAAATPRVQVETLGKSDEGRDLVVVWVSSEQNLKSLAQNRQKLGRLADPRTLSDADVHELLSTTKPNYHLSGGLHSSETGPPEMLMELVYRLATETSPLITQVRNNVYVSVTPVADPDGRDRYVDWFYQGLDLNKTATLTPVASQPPASDRAQAPAQPTPQTPPPTALQTTPQTTPSSDQPPAGGQRGAAAVAVPYWGKYVFHDNNRDINLSLTISRAMMDWYFSAHPPIMHDLHESQTLMYTYSGGPPQNPNLDPILFAELPWFSNWELAQMTKWGMPGIYTHAFMDAWSPGYYASVAYNHNALMKMYETQTGRDPGEPTSGARGATPDTAPTGARGAQPLAPVSGATAGQPARSGDAPRGARGAQPPAGGDASTASQARGGEAPRGGPTTPPAVPTGRGGSQDREWYRGIPVPPNAVASFTRRDNVNYQETGVLASLQLTAMFPETIVENFYFKTKNALEDGRTKAPFGYVIPVDRDMTRIVELVKVLRLQGIEVGQATAEFKVGDATYPAGSFVIKRDQPYGRLAKNLLERQVYPDARLTTYDDSGWTMGLLMRVTVKEIADAAILKVATTAVTTPVAKRGVKGNGTAALAVAHLGSNNMITFRYRFKDVTMKVAEKSFTAEGIDFPAGSFVIAGAPSAELRRSAEELGLTAAAVAAPPSVPLHEVKAPRVAIYSQWTSTQDLGWYRLTFDRLGVPYDLIFKEQVKQGNLRAKYDVIVMAAQALTRQTVMQTPAARPQPYKKTDKYKFLGAYGETADVTGGFGQEGVTAFEQFLESGGTLVAAAAAARFPIEFGWARTADAETITGVTAQRPILQAEIARPDHPVFYGYTEKTLAVKYTPGFTLRVGVADQANVLARYVGGDSSVLSGAMVGADQLRQKAFAIDVPRACNGKGRVLIFANNPIYRWQNQAEFNMVFNALINWDYVPPVR